jgi:hypothetical protein
MDRNFEKAIRKAMTDVRPRYGIVIPDDMLMVDRVFRFKWKYMHPEAVAAFQRDVQDIYFTHTGKRASFVTIAGIVGFLMLHWAEIMTALRVTLTIYRLLPTPPWRRRQ